MCEWGPTAWLPLRLLVALTQAQACSTGRFLELWRYGGGGSYLSDQAGARVCVCVEANSPLVPMREPLWMLLV